MKTEIRIQDANKFADKLNSMERGVVTKEATRSKKVKDAFKEEGMRERVMEFIFNKNISYEDSPLKDL